jgi:hypothetical protein
MKREIFQSSKMGRKDDPTDEYQYNDRFSTGFNDKTTLSRDSAASQRWKPIV